MGSTSIQWTDHSVNPIRARFPATKGDGHYCEKVSPGCTHCYSSRMQPRFGMPVFDVQRRGGVEHYFDDRKLREVLSRKKPTKYFWCDMSDLFGAWVPDEWIDRCFATMAATPHHVHQVLTKRPERARVYLTALGIPAGYQRLEMAARELGYSLRFKDIPLVRWPLPNVWLGTSVESPPYLTRLNDLRQTPAAVIFASFEPLLADLGDLARHLLRPLCYCCPRGRHRALDWVIVGGESGPLARPCDLAWVRSIVQQCQEAGVACFVKQLGAWPTTDERRAVATNGFPLQDGPAQSGTRILLRDRKGGDIAEFPIDLRIREYPHAGVTGVHP